MSSDVSGVGPKATGIPRAGNPGDGTGAIAPSRAVVRTTGVTRPALPPDGPLGRSGVGLLDVLGATDSLVARRGAAPLAMEIGLEQARGALVRQMPGDALAALDAVWQGAQHTEEGWFLRSGSLLVLGLPGECERVAERGLDERPHSTALRFAQSLARLAVGDPAGARAALQAALQRLPSDPLLLAQHAVVLATQGDGAGAEAALRAAGRRVGADDPAVQYGRDAVSGALRAVASERARQGAVAADYTREHAARDVATRDVVADAAGMHEVPARPTTTSDSSRVGARPTTDIASADARPHHDPITLVVRRLGARTHAADVPALVREIRVLLRSLSAGGTLGSSGRPEQAHAARTLLSIMASILTGEQSDAPPAKRALVSAVLATLRSGHPADAARAMRPLSASSPVVSESFAQLLHALVDGAQANVADTMPEIFPDMRPAPDGIEDWPNAVQTPASGDAADRTVIRDASQGVIVPVRLGLRLIDETPESRALHSPTFARIDERAVDTWQRPAFAESASPRPGFGDVAPDNPERSGAGWGAAGANAARLSGERAARGGSPGAAPGFVVRLAAVSCIVIAAVAATRGYSAVAVACGIGAAWLALRRSAGARRSGEEWTDTAEWPGIDEHAPPVVRDFGVPADESSGRR